MKSFKNVQIINLAGHYTYWEVPNIAKRLSIRIAIQTHKYLKRLDEEFRAFAKTALPSDIPQGDPHEKQDSLSRDGRAMQG